MDIVQHPLQEHLFALATTDCCLAIADMGRGLLVSSWEAHEKRINSLSFTNVTSDKDLVNVFFSASEDGFIKIWDTGMSNMVSSIPVNSPLYSVNCNGQYLIAGSDNFIYIWDVRSLKLLKKIKSHSDEVVSISFHPQKNNVWLTCGLDELLCQYNMEDTDVIEFTCRSEQPLTGCGFYGKDLEKQFAVTGAHNLELYDEVGNAKVIPRNSMGTDDSKIVGAYYDIKKNAITVGSTIPGCLSLYDVSESGELQQSGSWNLENTNSVLRSYKPIRNGCLLVTDEEGNICIGKSAKVTTKFDMEREVTPSNETKVGPIKDYKGGRKKSRLGPI